MLFWSEMNNLSSLKTVKSTTYFNPNPYPNPTITQTLVINAN